MGYSVRVTSSAHESVISSVGYIAEVCSAPRAAVRLLDSYEVALESLHSNPTFNPVNASASRRLGRNIYRKRAGSYFLYYFVDENTSEVVVFSFLHRRQDASAHLIWDYESS